MADIQACAQGRPVWQENTEAHNCTKCDRLFNMYHRRHHCRGCGKIVCDKCSPWRLQLPEEYELGAGKHRVCNDCWKAALSLQYEAGLTSGAIQAPDFVKVKVDLLEKATKYLSLPESQWVTRVYRNVKIATQPVNGHSIFAVRSEVLIKASIEKTRKVYGNMDMWRHWNPYVTAREVQVVDERSKVFEASYDAPIIRQRSSVFFCHTLDGSLVHPKVNEGTTTLAMSLEHPLCPMRKGIVNASIMFSMTSLESVEDDSQRTRLLSIVHSDPKGLLPPFVVNAFLARGADHLRGMCDYIENSSD